MSLATKSLPLIQHDTAIGVGLGELKAARGPDRSLVCYSLGSCVAIAAYDQRSMYGVMAHVVLPRSGGRIDGPPARYADLAVLNIVRSLTNHGIRPGQATIKLAGGARILQLGGLQGMDIGAQNQAAVLEALRAQRLTPRARDLGANYGRTVEFDLEDGSLKISSVGKPVLII